MFYLNEKSFPSLQNGAVEMNINFIYFMNQSILDYFSFTCATFNIYIENERIFCLFKEKKLFCLYCQQFNFSRDRELETFLNLLSILYKSSAILFDILFRST